MATRWPSLVGRWGQGTPRMVLVSDLDHTMVQHKPHDPGHAMLREFNRAWQSGLGLTSTLIYSSGRSPELYRALWAKAPLLTPQAIICSVGTEIFLLHDSSDDSNSAEGGGQEGRSLAQHLVYRADQAWERYLDVGWDRAKAAAAAAHFPQLRLQERSEQRPHKVSFKLDAPDAEAAAETLRQLSEELKAQGLDAKVIYSGGVDVDILPSRAGKGRALEFLLQGFRGSPSAWPRLGVQVNGDSGNDVEMFEVPGVKACAVGSDPQVVSFVEQRKDDPNVFLASRPCAGGIVEALHHFGAFDAFARDADAHERALGAVAGALHLLGTHLAATVAKPVADDGAAAATITFNLTKESVEHEGLRAVMPNGEGLVVRLAGGLELRQQQMQQGEGGQEGEQPNKKQKREQGAEQAEEEKEEDKKQETGQGVLEAQQVKGKKEEKEEEKEGKEQQGQQGQQPRAEVSWVDVLEVRFDREEPADEEARARLVQAHALFQVNRLLPDGSRDVDNSLTCYASISLTSEPEISVSCREVNVSPTQHFCLPS